MYDGGSLVDVNRHAHSDRLLHMREVGARKTAVQEPSQPALHDDNMINLFCYCGMLQVRIINGRPSFSQLIWTDSV